MARMSEFLFATNIVDTLELLNYCRPLTKISYIFDDIVKPYIILYQTHVSCYMLLLGNGNLCDNLLLINQVSPPEKLFDEIFFLHIWVCIFSHN